MVLAMFFQCFFMLSLKIEILKISYLPSRKSIKLMARALKHYFKNAVKSTKNRFKIEMSE